MQMQELTNQVTRILFTEIIKANSIGERTSNQIQIHPLVSLLYNTMDDLRNSDNVILPQADIYSFLKGIYLKIMTALHRKMGMIQKSVVLAYWSIMTKEQRKLFLNEMRQFKAQENSESSESSTPRTIGHSSTTGITERIIQHGAGEMAVNVGRYSQLVKQQKIFNKVFYSCIFPDDFNIENIKICRKIVEGLWRLADKLTAACQYPGLITRRQKSLNKALEEIKAAIEKIENFICGDETIEAKEIQKSLKCVYKAFHFKFWRIFNPRETMKKVDNTFSFLKAFPVKPGDFGKKGRINKFLKAMFNAQKNNVIINVSLDTNKSLWDTFKQAWGEQNSRAEKDKAIEAQREQLLFSALKIAGYEDIVDKIKAGTPLTDGDRQVIQQAITCELRPKVVAVSVNEPLSSDVGAAGSMVDRAEGEGHQVDGAAACNLVAAAVVDQNAGRLADTEEIATIVQERTRFSKCCKRITDLLSEIQLNERMSTKEKIKVQTQKSYIMTNLYEPIALISQEGGQEGRYFNSLESGRINEVLKSLRENKLMKLSSGIYNDLVDALRPLFLQAQRSPLPRSESISSVANSDEVGGDAQAAESGLSQRPSTPTIMPG